MLEFGAPVDTGPVMDTGPVLLAASYCVLLPRQCRDTGYRKYTRTAITTIGEANRCTSGPALVLDAGMHGEQEILKELRKKEEFRDGLREAWRNLRKRCRALSLGPGTWFTQFCL